MTVALPRLHQAAQATVYCRSFALNRRRPPPRLLCPAARRKGESKDLIGRLLGDAVRCFTTPCVQHELKKLGKEFVGELASLTGCLACLC
jgi:hypothetical protein